MEIIYYQPDHMPEDYVCERNKTSSPVTAKGTYRTGGGGGGATFVFTVSVKVS